MSVVKKHLTGKSLRQSQAFMSHARRYLEAYLPDSGFEFAITNRYKRSTAPLASSLADASSIAESSAAGAAANAQAKEYQAGPTKPTRGRRSGEVAAPLAAGSKADLCVVAVRDMVPGEIIPCKGGVKDLSKSEDEALRNEAAANRGRPDDQAYGGVLGQGRDFSIIKSSMRNCSQLLLGPARFVNHDCNPSVQFYRSGQQMMFKVSRSIKTNEEILVGYGDHYFGWENSECLCATCEARGKGAFTKDGVESLEDQEKNAATAADEEPPASDGRRAPSRRIRPPGDGGLPARPASNGNGSAAAGSGPPGLEPPQSEYANRRSASRALGGGVKTNAASDRELVDPVAAPGPKCQCITCGGPFYAPENWWLPDECKRCERHYRIFKADWPNRIPAEGVYAQLYEQAQKNRKHNGVGAGSGEDGEASSSVAQGKGKSKDVAPQAASPPPAKKRGRPSKNEAGPAVATPTPSLTSIEGSTNGDTPIRLSPLRPIGSAEPQPEAPKSSTGRKVGRPRTKGLTEDGNGQGALKAKKTGTAAAAFSDSGSDLTEPSSVAATEATRDPSIPSASSSVSGGDDRPAGPKMLGKEAKTEELAKYWGISDADATKRVRKQSMNGPVSLADRVGRQTSRSHRRSSSGISAVSVFEEDEVEEDLANAERKKKQKSLSRESKTSGEGSTPKAAVAEGSRTSSRSSSVAGSDVKPGSPNKIATASHSASSPLPQIVRKRDFVDAAVDPLESAPSAPSPSVQAPVLATHGTERTSIKNLAAFWSAGVDAGSRTRKQTQREPTTLLSNSGSPAISSPKRGREASGSQPPSSAGGDGKRQRGGRRSRGDDSGSAGPVGRQGIKQGSPSTSDGRPDTPSEAASPSADGLRSRPRSPLVTHVPRQEASYNHHSTAGQHQSPSARPLDTPIASSLSPDTGGRGSPSGGGTAVSTPGPAAYRHIPGRKNLRIGRPTSASRPLSSASPASNSVMSGHATALNGKEPHKQPVVGSTATGWPGVTYTAGGAGGGAPDVGKVFSSPLVQMTKVEETDGGLDDAPGRVSGDGGETASTRMEVDP